MNALNPYMLYIKLAGAAIVVLALIALLWSWHSRGQKIERLESWQTTVVIAASEATVKPDKEGKIKMLKPEQVVSAINGLKSSLVSADAALETISETYRQAKVRADKADRDLAARLAEFDQKYARAQDRINALSNRKPAATPAEQCKAIEIDSNAPWENWR